MNFIQHNLLLGQNAQFFHQRRKITLQNKRIWPYGTKIIFEFYWIFKLYFYHHLGGHVKQLLNLTINENYLLHSFSPEEQYHIIIKKSKPKIILKFYSCKRLISSTLKSWRKFNTVLISPGVNNQVMEPELAPQ